MEEGYPRGKFKRVCVFCGSNSGNREVFSDAAIQLGNELVQLFLQHSLTLLFYSLNLCSTSPLCFLYALTPPSLPLLLFCLCIPCVRRLQTVVFFQCWYLALNLFHSLKITFFLFRYFVIRCSHRTGYLCTYKFVWMHLLLCTDAVINSLPLPLYVFLYFCVMAWITG